MCTRRFAIRAFIAVALVGLLSVLASYVIVQRFLLSPDEAVTATFSPGEKVAGGTGDLWLRNGQYEIQACCKDSTALVRDPANQASFARRFSIAVDEPLVRGNHRAELRLRPNRLGETVWYRAGVLVPAGWTINEERAITLQWHGSKDFFIGETGRAPPLEIEVIGDRWVIAKAWDDRIRSNGGKGNVQGIEELASIPLEPGKWADWTVMAKWSSRDDGVLKIWLNGTLVVDDHGPNAHRDLMGPYLKAGIYVPSWHYVGPTGEVGQRVVFIRNVIESQASDPFGLLAR